MTRANIGVGRVVIKLQYSTLIALLEALILDVPKIVLKIKILHNECQKYRVYRKKSKYRNVNKRTFSLHSRILVIYTDRDFYAEI